MTLSIPVGWVAWAYWVLWAYAVFNIRREAETPGLWGRGWGAAALLLTVSLHAAVLFVQMYAGGQPQVGFAIALSATALACMVCFLWGGLFERIQGLRVILLPVAALMSVLPAYFPGRVAVGIDNPWWFVLHLASALLAYGALAFAVSLALALAVLDGLLHRRPTEEAAWWEYLKPLIALSPPLLSLERLMFRVIGVAFTVLSLTLLSGAVFAEELGLRLRWDHKTLFSVLAWSILAVLLAGHRRYGWRGRTALLYVLAGFLALLLAYVGTQFVLQMILHRV